MNEDILNKTIGQLESYMGPARKVSSLVIEHFSRVSEFQLEAFKAYSDLSVEQLRAVSRVTDAESLQDFLNDQTRIARTVSEKLNSDASTLAGFGKDLTDELQKLTQENVAAASRAASKAARAAKAA